MDELARDGMPEPPACPKWATCGTCGDCLTGEPFAWLADEGLRAALAGRCGLCAQDCEPPVVVLLDTTPKAMPCGGDGWWPR